MFEDLLVRYCSPTLAGIKTGNIFTYKGLDIYELIKKWNLVFEKYNMKMVILRKNGNTSLIYVYRVELISRLFSDKKVVDFFRNTGYENPDNYDMVIRQIQEKLKQNSAFPHEIGVILGYPLRDVMGFIKNNGKNFMLAGMWKVYDQCDDCKKTFSRYNNCTRYFLDRFEKGIGVKNLLTA